MSCADICFAHRAGKASAATLTKKRHRIEDDEDDAEDNHDSGDTTGDEDDDDDERTQLDGKENAKENAKASQSSDPKRRRVATSGKCGCCNVLFNIALWTRSFADSPLLPALNVFGESSTGNSAKITKATARKPVVTNKQVDLFQIVVVFFFVDLVAPCPATPSVCSFHFL